MYTWDYFEKLELSTLCHHQSLSFVIIVYAYMLRLRLNVCLAAVLFTHEQGVLNRDIKPANVLICCDSKCPLPFAIHPSA